jgi:hypothetical protein
MKHRPPLGQVDPFAGEERGDPVRQVRAFRRAKQRRQRGLVDALLGDVDEPVVPVERQRFRAIGIVGEELEERRRREPASAVGQDIG